MNIIFDNFLPNGPLPNLLDSARFIDYYKNQKNTFTKEDNNEKEDPCHTGPSGERVTWEAQVGMTINPFIVQLFKNKKANIIPSYLCDTLDTWVYPIDFVNPYFFGHTFLTARKPYDLVSFLSEKVFQGLLNKKGFLLLFFDGELIKNETINNFLSNTQIPNNKIIIISKCILNCDNFIYTTFNEVTTITEMIEKKDYIIEKTKKYICLNYKITSNYRKYRALVSALLLHHNLLDNAIISIGKEKNLYDYLEDNNKSFHIDVTNKILNNKKDLTDIPKFVNTEEIGKAFFNIVLDSYFLPESYSDELYITEKIYIPMYFKQFYVLFGRPYTLKFMKSIGYKTFDSIIDESYDNELNDEIRFMKAFKEVKRICSMNINHIKNLSQKVNSVLEFNYNHMQKRIDQMPVDLEEKINGTNI